MSTYKLTFTLIFDEHDDPAARQHAKKIAEAISEAAKGADMKLQEVFADQPPRGVRLG